MTPPYECLPQGHTELTEADRHWSPHNRSNLRCDRDVVVSGNWYRFKGPAGVMMSSHCIPKKSCSTNKPGWINGAHPTTLYQIVSVSACFHGLLGCCHHTETVKIRKCSGFFVYRLGAPKCYNRYCGVNGETCDKHCVLDFSSVQIHGIFA